MNISQDIQRYRCTGCGRIFAPYNLPAAINHTQKLCITRGTARLVAEYR